MPASTIARRSVSAGTLGGAVRPTLLFAAAYTLNTTFHEAFHALAAYWLGFSATIYPMWVDPERGAATPSQLAIVAIAGPIFSLTAGTIFLLVYSRQRLNSSGLLFLMLAFAGILCFLGPAAGASFGGDIHTALALLRTPRQAALAISIAGWLLLVAFTVLAGRELVAWAPPQLGLFASVCCATVLPALAGTMLILLFDWPLPDFLVASTISGAFFWIPATIGSAFGFRRSRPVRMLPAFTWPDAAVLIAAIATARIFAQGIRIVH